MRFTVKAPASSANIGPGFDALALAVDLWNEFEVEPGVAENAVSLSGSGAELLDGRENLSITAMKYLADRLGRTLPPVAITIRAEVPVARGLGSSASAIVCGLLAANEILDLGLTSPQLFAHAWRMEGHGDNVGAAIYGGAVLAVAGVADAIRLADGPELGLVAVVFIPEATGATSAARAALPANVPLSDAAFNLAAAASLSIGFARRNYEAISAGMHDRLHEPYRSRLFPHLTPMTEAARLTGAIGACLSGAGSSILALATPEVAPAVRDVFARTAQRINEPGNAVILDIAARGASLVRH